MRRRPVALGALLVGALTGVAFFHRRTDRVELFYDDGFVLTLTGEQAKPLLSAARSALEVART